MPRIIWVDPSLTWSGVCIMDTSWTLLDYRKLKPIQKEEARYRELSNRITDYIAERKPDLMAIEKQFTQGWRGNSVLKVSEVVGLFKCVFYQNSDKQIIQIAPMSMKKHMGISKLKSKEAKKAIVKIIMDKYWLEKEISHDEADAIGIARTALSMISWAWLIRRKN